MKNLVQQSAGARAQAPSERPLGPSERPLGPGAPGPRNMLHYTNVRTNDSTQSLSVRAGRSHNTIHRRRAPRARAAPPRSPARRNS